MNQAAVFGKKSSDTFVQTIVRRAAVSFIFLAFAFCGAQTSSASPPIVGEAMPSLEGLTTHDSKPFSIVPTKGRLLVMTFSASWCPPCKKELPELTKLAKAYRKSKAPVDFFAVNIDINHKDGVAFMKELKLAPVRAVFDPERKVVERISPPKMPTTYIVSGGILVAKHEGFKKDDEKLVKAVIDSALLKLK